MTTKPLAFLPNHPFWTFSCQTYEQAKVALLALQNRHNLNVNVLLFCCWIAASNQGTLSKQEIKKLLAVIHTWHERIVVPLRELRARLKESTLVYLTENLIEEALDIEITAEHIEQLFMLDVTLKKAQRKSKNLTFRATQTCQNIELYRQIVYVYFDEKDCVYLSEILAILYPEIGINKAFNICHSIFLAKKKPQAPVKKQMELELLEE